MPNRTINQYRVSGTPSGGILSKNIAFETAQGILRQILVKTEDNITYEVKITNPFGFTVYERTSELGATAELVTIPVRGTYTIGINLASQDENFDIELDVEE